MSNHINVAVVGATGFIGAATDSKIIGGGYCNILSGKENIITSGSGNYALFCSIIAGQDNLISDATLTTNNFRSLLSLSINKKTSCSRTVPLHEAISRFSVALEFQDENQKVL